MAKGPDHWGIAEVVLDSGLAGERPIDRVMVVARTTREEAITALKYAKEQGAGKQFDRLRQLYK